MTQPLKLASASPLQALIRETREPSRRSEQQAEIALAEALAVDEAQQDKVAQSILEAETDSRFLLVEQPFPERSALAEAAKNPAIEPLTDESAILPTPTHRPADAEVTLQLPQQPIAIKDVAELRDEPDDQGFAKAGRIAVRPHGKPPINQQHPIKLPIALSATAQNQLPLPDTTVIPQRAAIAPQPAAEAKPPSLSVDVKAVAQPATAAVMAAAAGLLTEHLAIAAAETQRAAEAQATEAQAAEAQATETQDAETQDAETDSQPGQTIELPDIQPPQIKFDLQDSQPPERLGRVMAPPKLEADHVADQIIMFEGLVK
ncbi:MAG: hypothetical protein HC771_21155 [Synechococcales cyanobacterium CRU_2_2]|nr:hypothetical protein [Synechococcales cyanobacterium CRU_2_2]